MAPPEKIPSHQRRVPRQARSRATMGFILETAARILREDGRAALTTNLVAERAGIGIGTLYGYFPDKEAILIALARRMIDEDTAALRAALDSDEAEPLRLLVRTLLNRHRDDRALRREVMSVHLGQGLGPEHARPVAEISALLARRAPGLLGRTPPPEQMFVLTRAVLGIARALAEDGDGAGIPPDRLENEVLRLIRAYLDSA